MKSKLYKAVLTTNKKHLVSFYTKGPAIVEVPAPHVIEALAAQKKGKA